MVKSNKFTIDWFWCDRLFIRNER